MITFAAARTALASYLVWVKVAVLAAVFLLGLRGGCAWQGNRDAATISGLRADLKIAGTELRAAGQALREVSARTRAAEARALASQKANEASVEGARQDAEAFADAKDRLEREIADAKRRSDTCRAELEKRPCAPLH